MVWIVFLLPVSFSLFEFNAWVCGLIPLITDIDILTFDLRL